MRARLLTVALVAAGCGAQSWGGDDSVDVDSGSSGDASDTCYVGVEFSPVEPVAGETIYATAMVPDASGQFLEYTWTVLHEGSDVPFVLSQPDGSVIRFDSTNPGPHYVQLSVGGSSCLDFDAPLNVRAPGATDTTWRVRFVAPPGSLAAPQERSVVVPSAADFDMGEVSLDPGAVISGTIEDTSGAPMAAYLRLVPAGTPDVQIDGFAGSDGAYAVRTTLEHHDLLIIPFRDDIPPMTLLDWTPSSQTFVLDGGTVVTGAVRDPANSLLPGATVTVRLGGVPSTVAVTDGSGAFSVRVRPSGTQILTVDVVPPAGSGLPRLATSGAVVDLGQPLQLRYAASLATRDVAGVAVEQAGTPAPDAEVTFTGTIASAGTLTAGTTTTGATGSFAITVAASGGGVLPAALVPAAPASAIVTPASGAPGVVSVDLTTAAPAAIDAPAGATLTGRVVGPDGLAVGSADLRAIPSGALAAAEMGQVHALADGAGSFSLPLAGGGAYELVISDRARQLALLRTALVVAGPASLGDLELPDGLTLRGNVRLNGSTLAGAAVTIFCETCPDDERDLPAAESSTDGGGTFRATVVDPGLPQ